MENQQLKTKNAQKYFIKPGQVYGNFKAIEEVKIQTNKCVETRWRCLHLPTNTEKFERASYLAKFPTLEEQQAKLDKMVEEDKHQLGFRNYLFRNAQKGAKERKHEFNLSYDEFIDIIKQPCYYCGEPPRPATMDQLKKRGNTKEPTFYYNGIDRIDPDGNYDSNNCVPCCPICNYMKHTQHKEDFYKHILKIVKHLGLSSTTIPEGSTTQANGVGNGENPEMD